MSGISLSPALHLLRERRARDAWGDFVADGMGGGYHRTDAT